ncbi:hypothetical protein CHKEEEPN_3577 [Methylorubrum podarium]|nr:hypothetical protein CHKEEEPN_3577 [Methylorubrum podarium]
MATPAFSSASRFTRRELVRVTGSENFAIHGLSAA